ncbi:FCS-Like Zinc finger 8-like [Typha latifolia]|uniref:FCS-Like Zinc finger 8-like n=1 Tax=Typha latifolia TaxID=4733 RepID=UPI003C2D33F7
MLRKKSESVSSKQNLISETTTFSLASLNNKLTSSSLFPSPKLFLGFSITKPSLDSESSTSPTSTLELETKPFFSEKTTRWSTAPSVVDENKRPWENGDSKAIGLGLVDALSNDKSDTRTWKPESRMVLFGSQLKIQIPPVRSNPISPTGSLESRHSPIEFGIKNKSSQLAFYSPARRSPMGSTNLDTDMLSSSPQHFTGCLSPREMELSEDYTCVISHGPNPRTTHIFDNCIVESCSDGFIPLRKDNRFSPDHVSLVYGQDDFLSYCHTCKKHLGQGKDIFMYRGEKAFCSSECRYQEMLFDEGPENCSLDLL